MEYSAPRDADSMRMVEDGEISVVSGGLASRTVYFEHENSSCNEVKSSTRASIPLTEQEFIDIEDSGADSDASQSDANSVVETAVTECYSDTKHCNGLSSHEGKHVSSKSKAENNKSGKGRTRASLYDSLSDAELEVYIDKIRVRLQQSLGDDYPTCLKLLPAEPLTNCWRYFEGPCDDPLAAGPNKTTAPANNNNNFDTDLTQQQQKTVFAYSPLSLPASLSLWSPTSESASSSPLSPSCAVDASTTSCVSSSLAVGNTRSAQPTAEVKKPADDVGRREESLNLMSSNTEEKRRKFTASETGKRTSMSSSDNAVTTNFHNEVVQLFSAMHRDSKNYIDRKTICLICNSTTCGRGTGKRKFCPKSRCGYCFMTGHLEERCNQNRNNERRRKDYLDLAIEIYVRSTHNSEQYCQQYWLTCVTGGCRASNAFSHVSCSAAPVTRGINLSDSADSDEANNANWPVTTTQLNPFFVPSSLFPHKLGAPVHTISTPPFGLPPPHLQSLDSQDCLVLNPSVQPHRNQQISDEIQNPLTHIPYRSNTITSMPPPYLYSNPMFDSNFVVGLHSYHTPSGFPRPVVYQGGYQDQYLFCSNNSSSYRESQFVPPPTEAPPPLPPSIHPAVSFPRAARHTL